MIHLNYQLNLDEIDNIEQVDLATATPIQLAHSLFTGDVEFRVDDQAFDAPWGWVTILDFASKLNYIARKIAEEETDSLEFTESEETISFHRHDNCVDISATYIESRAKVTLKELQDAAAEFLGRVTDELITRWPALKKNPCFADRASCGGREFNRD